MTTSATKRTCERCRAILSRYNQGTLCGPCHQTDVEKAVERFRAQMAAREAVEPTPNPGLANLKPKVHGTQWAKARAMLEEGPMTARQIAERLGVDNQKKVNALVYRMLRADVVEVVGRVKQDCDHRTTTVRLYGLTTRAA